MDKKLLIIGSLNMDMVTEMEKMPLIGETILGDELKYIPGGKGANQAYAAGSLGKHVSMLGCVGNDEFGKGLIRSLEEKKVDVSLLKKSDTNTGTAIIYVDNDGNNSIVVIPGANMECDVQYLKQREKMIQECDYLLLQMEIPYESVCYAVETAYKFHKTIILNPAPAPDYIGDEILSKLDYITPNETELMKLANGSESDMDSMKKYACELLKKGVKNVIVTMGDQGCLLVNEKNQILYPARKVEAVDTTAAGDCFNGALTVGLAEGKSIEQAILFANAASSLAVTKKGAQSSIPSREEVDYILQALLCREEKYEKNTCNY